MATAEPRTHVFIVGNAPDARHPLARIETAERVVRFNNAPGFGSLAGSRVTDLALVNHGGQMREWLDEPDFRLRPVVRAARSILFPFAPKPEPAASEDADGRDWTREARAMLAPLAIPVVVIAPKIHAQARHILRTPEQENPNPSTGFLVALHVLAELQPDARMEASGFGFAGWPGHSWAAERRWFERMHAKGRLRLHPVAETR